MVWLLALLPPQTDAAADDVAIAFDKLTNRLAEAVERYNNGEKTVDLSILDVALLNLEAAFRARAGISVDSNTARSLTLNAKNRALFGDIPMLPAEDKRNGRWYFRPIRFDLIPSDLYTFAISFRSDITIRLRSVRLIFQDGSDMVDDRWLNMENGNGEAFPKDTALPWITVTGPDDPKRAKTLAAVEILGSGQDGNRAARLQFQLEIPDPAAEPSGDTLALIGRVKRFWNGQTASANRLNKCLMDCRDLANALNIPFCFDTPAVD